MVNSEAFGTNSEFTHHIHVYRGEEQADSDLWSRMLLGVNFRIYIQNWTNFDAVTSVANFSFSELRSISV